MPDNFFDEEHRIFRDSVRTFVEREIVPYHSQWEKDGVVPRALWEIAGAHGFLCLQAPEAYGGVGADDFRYNMIVIEELTRVGASGPGFTVHGDIVAPYLIKYGSEEQKQRYLPKMVAGECIGAIAMTEPDTGSDLAAVKTTALRDGDEYVINGRKWWTSGAPDPRCKILIFMGKTDPDNVSLHSQQSMILVPMDAPGVTMVRPLNVFGYDHAPHGHGEVSFENVRVPVSNILLGEGRGFEIAQGRLGPGRIHHCMRLIGLAERALELMCKRALSRVAFHKPVADQGVTRERIAEARCLIDQARLLTFNAAWMMDTAGNKIAQQQIAMIKVVAPNMACQVIDWAMQVHGGGGISDDFLLAAAYAGARTLRLADGPDEVHRNQIAKYELGKYL